MGDLGIAEQNLSTGGVLQAGNHPERGCLPASRWPQQGKERTRRDRQRKVIDSSKVTECLGQIHHVQILNATDDRHGHSPFERVGSLRPGD